MAVPFLVGLFSSIKKNAKGSVKEAVKRQNGDLEKLRIKEEACRVSVEALEAEREKSLKGLGAIVSRVRALENKPRFDELSISSVKLIPFSEKDMADASEDPAGFIAKNASSIGWEIIDQSVLPSPADADIAWDAMLENERKINGWFAYYDSLQVLAEKYEHSLGMVRGLYETHISVLDQFKEKNGKTDWSDFGDAQKMAYQNAVLLAKLIYEMCSVGVLKHSAEDDTDRVNSEACLAMTDKAKQFCGERGFEYDGTTYDVVLKGSSRDYFNYCYRLEKKLPLILPISTEQAAPILEKLRMEGNVSISREVTHLHARTVMDSLRDIDIKTQRMISPDGTSVYYIEIV